MPRTNSTAVKELLLSDYDTDTNPSLDVFISTANVITTRVNTCATARSITLSSDELELIERWLAAHFYVMNDQTFSSKSTQGASASFHGQTGMNLDASKYGQSAKIVDYSGCLTAIAERRTARAFWMGRPPSEQTAYTDRD